MYCASVEEKLKKGIYLANMRKLLAKSSCNGSPPKMPSGRCCGTTPLVDESSSSDIEVYSNKSSDKDESENIAQNSLVEERMTLNENIFDKIFNILQGPLTDV